MSGEQRVGIYRKYEVKRTDGSSAPGEKHENCRYFVLDLMHDPFAKPALLAYARACAATHPALAEDLRGVVQSFRFKGGRVLNGLRCLGARPENNFARCKNIYKGQAGWDFVGVRPFDGWVCPSCRKRFLDIFNQPGLPRPAVSPKKKRYPWKAVAKRNKKAFGSTKSKDGEYPI